MFDKECSYLSIQNIHRTMYVTVWIVKFNVFLHKKNASSVKMLFLMIVVLFEIHSYCLWP